MAQVPPSPASLFRANIEAMVGYVPGEQPPANAKIIKLNTNENPYPPSPRVVEAIQAELGAEGERLRLYSDPEAMLLRRAAASRFGRDVSEILHGNGSDELLALLFRAFVDPGDRVAYPVPTYVLYETLALAQGAQVETHEFDRSYHLPASLQGSQAKLVFLASPNSPSGTSHSLAQIEALAKSLTRGVLVVDEAYAEFANSTALDLLPRLSNLVVLRTFSKSDSLAGMRVGLLFSSPEIVTGLRKVKDSYNLDRLAIVAAAAALADPAWTRNNVQRILATRARLIAALTGFGLEVLNSEANFVLARFGSKTRAVGAFNRLKEHKILVRYFSQPQLEDALRISIGTDDETEQLLSVLATFVAEA
jgi:histidinol-phosphate aminotransferase